MTDPREYVLRSLASFVGDPPDNDFQRGFMEALIVVAREAFEIRGDDAEIMRFAGGLRPISKRRFVAIDGDKK